MKISELGELFPKNKIITDSYYSENSDLINIEYERIKELFEALKKQEVEYTSILPKLLKARMAIETLKIPIMLDLAKEGIDNGYSVVLFVNFKETLNNLCHYLKTDCIICGGQSLRERQDQIDRFQSNKSNIIILMIQAGGVGISLHDIHGGHPRMSIINPSWSGQDMQQAFGRIHRAGAKTPAIQKIIYVSETFEDYVKNLVDSKIKNITGINDLNMDSIHDNNENTNQESNINNEVVNNEVVNHEVVNHEVVNHEVVNHEVVNHEVVNHEVITSEDMIDDNVVNENPINSNNIMFDENDDPF
jgi:hypothetical protein